MAATGTLDRQIESANSVPPLDVSARVAVHGIAAPDVATRFVGRNTVILLYILSCWWRVWGNGLADLHGREWKMWAVWRGPGPRASTFTSRHIHLHKVG